jgi:hypothetical protein
MTAQAYQHLYKIEQELPRVMILSGLPALLFNIKKHLTRVFTLSDIAKDYRFNLAEPTSWLESYNLQKCIFSNL